MDSSNLTLTESIMAIGDPSLVRMIQVGHIRSGVLQCLIFAISSVEHKRLVPYQNTAVLADLALVSSLTFAVSRLNYSSCRLQTINFVVA